MNEALADPGGRSPLRTRELCSGRQIEGAFPGSDQVRRQGAEELLLHPVVNENAPIGDMHPQNVARIRLRVSPLPRIGRALQGRSTPSVGTGHGGSVARVVALEGPPTKARGFQPPGKGISPAIAS